MSVTIRFKCGRCMSPVEAMPSQVGKKARCPSCFAVVTVPKESTKPSGKTLYVSVECPLCATVIEAPASDVGKKIPCPDCETKVVVPPPSAVVTGTDEAQRDRAPVSKVEHIRVYCPVCNTMMYGKPQQIGKKIKCPDCYTKVEVPEPKEEPGRLDSANFRVAEDDTYKLQDERIIQVNCPDCDVLLEITQAQLGVNMTCPDCGGLFYVE